MDVACEAPRVSFESTSSADDSWFCSTSHCAVENSSVRSRSRSSTYFAMISLPGNDSSGSNSFKISLRYREHQSARVQFETDDDSTLLFPHVDGLRVFAVRGVEQRGCVVELHFEKEMRAIAGQLRRVSFEKVQNDRTWLDQRVRFEQGRVVVLRGIPIDEVWTRIRRLTGCRENSVDCFVM